MSSKMNIIMNGVPRSGSTLVRQLISSCLGRTVPVTHPAAPIANDHSFISIRHPHDVLASRYRVRLIRDANTHGEGGIRAEYNEMAKHFDAIARTRRSPNTLVRYEQFYNDYDIIFDALELVTGEEVVEATRILLKAEHSLERNYQRMRVGEEMHIYEEGPPIHEGHIGTVHPGHWIEYMPERFHALVRSLCSRLCKEHGYA